MNFIKYSRIFYIFSTILILGSLFSILFFGFNLGIDFTGGSIIELEFQEDVFSNQEIQEKLKDIELGTIVIQPTQEKGVIIRTKNIDEEIHQDILNKLGNVKELRFENIGPVIGKELARKTQIAIVFALLSIIIYITFAFSKVTHPVKSWQYSIAALIALFHDVLISLGVFVILGEFYGVEITIPIIAAVLTILGYSINDTVVVFDRIRENLLRKTYVSFEETVNKSLNQTLVRSINTGLTVLLALFAIYFFGGETLEYFSLALIIGIVAGTYSSIFIASPLVVSWAKWIENKK